MLRKLFVLPVLAIALVLATMVPAHAGVARVCSGVFHPIANSAGVIDLRVCVDTGNGNFRGMVRVSAWNAAHTATQPFNAAIPFLRGWINSTKVQENSISWVGIGNGGVAFDGFNAPSDACTTGHVHADAGGAMRFRFNSNPNVVYEVPGPTQLYNSGTLTGTPGICF